MKKTDAEDMVPLLLQPAELRKPSRYSMLKYFQTQYLFILVISACMGFYLSYTNTLSWRLVEMLQIGKDFRTIETSIAKFEKIACNFPKLNPFDASVMPYDEFPDPVNCEKDHPLIFTTDFESNLIQVKNYTAFGYVSCCYQKFEREDGGDSGVIVDKNCVRINESKTNIPSTTDFIKVSCLRGPKFSASTTQVPGNPKNGTQEAENNNTSSFPEGSPSPETFILQPVDMFGFIHLKTDLEERILQLERNAHVRHLANETPHVKTHDEKPSTKFKEVKRKVNVVVLGLDAVSHMNFQRVMPLTYKYIVKNLSALGVSGYTKVGDNTFPNIVPVLTGLFVEEIQKGCWKNESDHFDDCPFIWKTFSSQGYRTAYGEDAVGMGNFEYMKQGFLKPPTDYYYNALTYQLDDTVGHHHMWNANLCYGPRIGFAILLDYLKKMAFTMNKTRRYFQFVWANSLFHDYLGHGKLGDKILLETLQWFKNRGYLEDTVFILMSDHGIRWGNIVDTLQGRLEQRMPFLYFIFPEWFKKKFKLAVNNLIINEQRLTSPFDLHETLLDLLNLENLQDLRKRYNILDQNKLQRGISLFLPIPGKRTCKDAEIIEHWCVCRLRKPIKVENCSLVEAAALSIVSRINRMFENFPQCLRLSLNKVFNAQLHMHNTEFNEFTNATIIDFNGTSLANQEVTLTVSFEVRPSKATFEAAATRKANSSYWEVSSQISRTNSYKDQSVCVSEYNMKKFCFCG